MKDNLEFIGIWGCRKKHRCKRCEVNWALGPLIQMHWIEEGNEKESRVIFNWKFSKREVGVAGQHWPPMFLGRNQYHHILKLTTKKIEIFSWTNFVEICRSRNKEAIILFPFVRFLVPSGTLNTSSLIYFGYRLLLLLQVSTMPCLYEMNNRREWGLTFDSLLCWAQHSIA